MAEPVRVRADLVELADLIERRQVRPAQLDGAPTQRVPGLSALHQPPVLKHSAEVEGRGLGNAQRASYLSEPEWGAMRVGEQRQDRDRSSCRGCGTAVACRFDSQWMPPST